jgi:hypothetical protein
LWPPFQYAQKTNRHENREMQANVRRRYCGHGFVPLAQGGKLLRGGRCFDAWNIVRVVARIVSTIRLQPKLTKRRNILAKRTRSLIRCEQCVSINGQEKFADSWGPLTRSLAFSFSVAFSCFSTKNSSRKVGLRGFKVRPGVPGTLRALLRGDAGGS